MMNKKQNEYIPDPKVQWIEQSELKLQNSEKPYKSIGRRIKKIMGTDTQDDLGNRLGKKSGAIVSKWVNGHSLPMTNDIMKLAEIYGVSVDYILFGVESKANHPTSVRDGTEEYTMKVDKQPTTRVLIPYYGDVAAGTFQDTYADPDVETIMVDKSYLDGSGEYFALKVNGDSMNKVIVDGSNIIVLRFADDTHKIINGDILLVRWGNEYTIKRVRKIENKIRLEPDSYIDGFTIQEFTLDEDIDVQIIGKVVYSFVKLLD